MGLLFPDKFDRRLTTDWILPSTDNKRESGLSEVSSIGSAELDVVMGG